MNGQKGRMIQLDYIRCLACLMVIMLHVIPNYFDDYLTLLLHAALSSSVPIFLFLTGFLLFQKEQGMTQYYKTVCLRYLLPFLIAYVFVEVIDVWGYHRYDTVSVIRIFQHFIAGNTEAACGYHLWYMFSLIAVFLFYPVLYLLRDNSGEVQRIIWILIGIGIVTAVCFPLLKTYGWKIDLPTPYCAPFPVYVLVGYKCRVAYDNGTLKKIKRYRMIFLMLYILATMIMAALSWALDRSVNYTTFIPRFYQHAYNPLLLLAALALFVFLLLMDPKNRRIIDSFIIFSSRQAFGIYLIHPLIMACFSLSGINIQLQHYLSMSYYPLYTVFIYFLSLFLLTLIRFIWKYMIFPMLHRNSPYI